MMCEVPSTGMTPDGEDRRIVERVDPPAGGDGDVEPEGDASAGGDTDRAAETSGEGDVVGADLVDHAARGQEGMGLVKEVGDKVQSATAWAPIPTA